MLIYGKQTVLYLVEHHPAMINTLYLSKEVDKNLYHKMMQAPYTLQRTKPEHVQSLCKSGNHQGFLADVEPLVLGSINEIKNYQKIIVLAGLTDMGNMGAILRSAYALGMDAVIIGGIKNIQMEQLARTSSGAIFDLPIVHVPTLNDLPNMLKQFGFTLYGAAMDGENVTNVQFDEKSALFVGNEAEGLSTRLQKALDRTVSIAMAHDFDSLNVSVATGILMHRMGT